MNYIGNATDEFHRWFELLNKEYFNGELSQPIFTIQRARSNNYGHFTLNPVWQGKSDDDTPNYEINIAAHQLHRDATDICGTVLHEMIHQYHRVNDIKDCNNNVHNKRFKKKAEEIGFAVEKSKSYGWGHTEIDGDLKTFIMEVVKPNNDVFQYARMPSAMGEEKPTKPKTQFKYTCPSCEATARAKVGVNLMCGDCGEEMEIEE